MQGADCERLMGGAERDVVGALAVGVAAVGAWGAVTRGVVVAESWSTQGEDCERLMGGAVIGAGCELSAED